MLRLQLNHHIQVVFSLSQPAKNNTHHRDAMHMASGSMSLFCSLSVGTHRHVMLRETAAVTPCHLPDCCACRSRNVRTVYSLANTVVSSKGCTLPVLEATVFASEYIALINLHIKICTASTKLTLP